MVVHRGHAVGDMVCGDDGSVVGIGYAHASRGNGSWMIRTGLVVQECTDSLAQLVRFVLALDVADEAELVATDAGDRVAGANVAGEPMGDVDEESVTAAWPCASPRSC